MDTKNVNESIKIIGVGGAGCNDLAFMYKYNRPKEVDLWVFNTDKESLERNPVPNKLLLGKEFSIGTNREPQKGLQAAQESEEQIKEVLAGSTMVYLIAATSGGTGAGATPYIAKLCKEMGLPCVAVITTPFSFESLAALKRSQAAITQLRNYIDKVLVVDNEKRRHLPKEEKEHTHSPICKMDIREIYDYLEELRLYTAQERENSPKEEAEENKGKLNFFDSTSQTVASIVGGLVNIFQDNSRESQQFLAAQVGIDIIARGIAKGEDRAKKAVAQILASLEEEVGKIKKIFLILNYDKQPVTLDEVAVINEEITKAIGNQLEYSFVIGQDFSQGDNLSVTFLLL